jgi:MFS family permease
MAFTNLAVFGGAFFTPILVGKITHSIGWPWTFYFIAIFCGACLPAIYFFCPETAYRRDTALNLDLLDTNSDSNAGGQKGYTAAYELHGNNAAIHDLHGNNAHAHELDGNNPPIHELDGNNAPSHGLDANTDATSHGLDDNTNSPGHGLNSNTDAPSHGLNGNNARTNAVNGEANQSGESSRVVEANEAAKPVMKPKATFRQSLALFNGRKTDESFWKLLLRPLPLFLQPAFLWACLIQGTMIGWTVFIGVILAQFFLATPLWWNEVQTGYAYTGAFIGAILGFAIAGVLSDWTARKMTKWNNGVYEPEFRIVLVIPQMILGCAGLYGWGITVDGLLHSRYHWAVPLTFFALEVAGMVIGAVASSLYIVDAYRTFPPNPPFSAPNVCSYPLPGGLAIEAFTCMIVFKNIFSFALTLKAFDWLVRSGSKATILFNALGSVQLVICLLSIPMCKSIALWPSL